MRRAAKWCSSSAVALVGCVVTFNDYPVGDAGASGGTSGGDASSGGTLPGSTSTGGIGGSTDGTHVCIDIVSPQ